MATTTIDAREELTMFTTPPGIIRDASIFPLGQLAHYGQVAAPVAVAGDVIQLNLTLPTNYAYRLRHLGFNLKMNSTFNNWKEGLLRVYWAPGEQIDTSTVTQFEYSLAHSANSDSNQNFWGLGMPHDIAENVDMQMLRPDFWVTSVPAGVSTWDPAIRVTANSACPAGTLTYNVLWDVINIEQRNHVGVNTVVPVI